MGWSTEAIAKGVAAEYLAKVYFLNKGYCVLTPETHEKPFDFVIERDGVYQKIQVKADSQTKDYIRFRNKHGSVNRPYLVEDYDILAGIWVDTKKIYLFKSEDVNTGKCGESITVGTKSGRVLRKRNIVTPYKVDFI